MLVTSVRWDHSSFISHYLTLWLKLFCFSLVIFMISIFWVGGGGRGEGGGGKWMTVPVRCLNCRAFDCSRKLLDGGRGIPPAKKYICNKACH